MTEGQKINGVVIVGALAFLGITAGWFSGRIGDISNQQANGILPDDLQKTQGGENSAEALAAMQEEVRALNDSSYILQSIPAPDPSGNNMQCLRTGEVFTQTNLDVFIHTSALGGGVYGPSGPVTVYQSGQQIAEFDPRTDSVPDNLVGLREGLVVCADQD